MNYSKVRFAAFLAAFMLCAGFLFAQNSPSSENNSSKAENLTQSQIEESQFTFDENIESPAAVQPKGTSGFWIFVRMIIVLGIVIGIMYFIFRLMKNTMESTKSDDPFLRKVAGINLGPGKSVQVVTLVDRGFLLGVSEDSVNFLCEIDDKELINAMNVHCDRTSSQFKAKNFAEVLEMFVPKKNHDEKYWTEKPTSGVYDSSTQDLINSIKRKKMQSGATEKTEADGGNK